MVNGILCVLRTGAPWRDMPKRYGNWNSVFVRFTRWSKLGVWDAAFEILTSLGPPADQEHAIDSTIVRAHQHAAGANGDFVLADCFVCSGKRRQFPTFDIHFDM
jgi:putative transposase